MSLAAGALATFDQPSVHNQIRAIYVRKLGTLSGARCTVQRERHSNGISDIHRFSSTS